MKYPASKYYSHLDLGEPIPEIEPRIDPERVRITRCILRIWMWELVTLFILIVFFFFVDTGRWIPVVSALMVIAFFLIPMFRVGARRKRMSKHKDDPWGIPLGLQLRFNGAMIATMFMVQMVNIVGSGLISIMLMLGLSLLVYGIMGILAAFKAREPGQISCEVCSYPLVGLTLPTSCPECGHALLDLSYTTDRPKLRDHRLRNASVAVTVLGLILFAPQFVAPQLYYAPIPRAALLPLAARDRDAFEQLMKQPLNASEEQQLLDAMIANSTTSSYRSSFDQGQWLEAQIFAGKLSDQQLDALFMPTTEIEIDAPDRARVGQPVELRLRGEYVRLPSFSTTPGYYFRGFVVGDSGTAMGGSTNARFRLYLTDSEYEREPDVPVSTWTATEPGPVRVRARVVLALFPGGGRAARVPIDWSSPDSLFSTAPVWSHVVDLEHTITIVE